MNLQRIRHFGIVTCDMPSSLHFYRDVLGFKIYVETQENSNFIDQVLALKNSSLHTVKLAAPDGQMSELLDFSSHRRLTVEREIYAIGPTHLAIQVENLEQLQKILEKCAVPCLSSPVVSPDNKVKLMFCQAPEGTYIEIVEVL